MVTITLNQIKKHNPCTDGWKKVLKANGGINADMDKPFSVSSILDSNGLDDTLWTLRCLPEYDVLWREFACWCALINIEKIKPYCSSEDYDLVVKYLTTQDEKITRSAARSAESAAESAARSAARSARSAARSAVSAAWSAAWSAARSATESAWSAWSATESAISDKLRELLDNGELSYEK